MPVKDVNAYLEEADCTPLLPWLMKVLAETPQAFLQHGDYPRWRTALNAMGDQQTNDIDLTAGVIRIGNRDELEPAALAELERNLQQLHPWRKGPFDVFGIAVDTEWRSDWKWQRLSAHIAPLDQRRVLDIGCGNGYYMLRMLGAGARWVLGMDPTPLFSMQFQALTQLIHQPLPARIITLGVDELPDRSECFDTTFSMGVIYHRRSPLDHLRTLRNSLREGGELVLETLVVDGPTGMSLMPEGRYAKMRNVWFIPSTGTLELWLRRSGFHDIRTVDVTITSSGEQHATDWMRFESLEDFLDPADRSKTIEGYPAPMRAIVVATRT